jgi:hypothetical protein
MIKEANERAGEEAKVFLLSQFFSYQALSFFFIIILTRWKEKVFFPATLKSSL